jgi:hypothetical protein
MPWNRHLYPGGSPNSPEWAAIRARIRARAQDRCERCGRVHGQTYTVVWDGTGRWLDLDLPESQTPDGSPMSEWVGVWRDRTGQVCDPPGGAFRQSKIALTCSHLNHDPTDNRDENLAALCQSCHLYHDRHFHAHNRRRMRRYRMERKGQLPLHVDETKET